MELFESYHLRIDAINAMGEKYGISSLQEAQEICDKAGFDAFEVVKKIQPIAFTDAGWAYTLGAAAAIKMKAETPAKAAEYIGEALQAFAIKDSVADKRKLGIGHGKLAAMLLSEEIKCFCFLAGHDSFAASGAAIGVATAVNKVRREPLRVILNGLGKDAAQIISRLNGFTYVKTEYDHISGEIRVLEETSFSDGDRKDIRCFGADSVDEGVAIMKTNQVDISISGNATNMMRFIHPVAGIYKKSCLEAGKKYFAVASGGGIGRSLNKDDVGVGAAAYAVSDTFAKMYGDVMFAGSSSVPAHVEMMGFIGMGNNPITGATVQIAVLACQAANMG